MIDKKYLAGGIIAIFAGAGLLYFMPEQLILGLIITIAGIAAAIVSLVKNKN